MNRASNSWKKVTSGWLRIENIAILAVEKLWYVVLFKAMMVVEKNGNRGEKRHFELLVCVLIGGRSSGVINNILWCDNGCC